MSTELKVLSDLKQTANVHSCSFTVEPVSGVMIMVMVINSAYTGPQPRYLWCQGWRPGV